MKISIITATYNSEKTLAKNLNSVAQQTKLNKIEQIIIDNRSVDNTIKIANKYNHVAKILSEKDRGIYHAFNKGLHYATGDIIFFLNSDDYFYDHSVVEDIIMFFTSEVQYVIGKVIMIDPIENKKYLYPEGENSISDYKHPCHQGFACRKEMFEKHGRFNECFRSYADTYFMKNIVTKEKGIFTNRVFCNYLKGGASELNNQENAIENNLLKAMLDLKFNNNKIDIIQHEKSTKNLIRDLFIRSINNQIKLKKLKNKQIYILGIHQLSKIIYDILKNKKINVAGYAVTNSSYIKNPTDKLNASIYNIDLDKLEGVIINCIEGPHEETVSKQIKKTKPNLKVISWREI